MRGIAGTWDDAHEHNPATVRGPLRHKIPCWVGREPSLSCPIGVYDIDVSRAASLEENLPSAGRPGRTPGLLRGVRESCLFAPVLLHDIDLAVPIPHGLERDQAAVR